MSPRVLTIEDEPAIRDGIVAFLEDSGFQMLEAGDGPDGIECFRQEHPDVVLCDLRLPGLDGLDVLSTIAGESPETPIIIVSGANGVDDAVQALKRGAWDYVVKPIEDMDDLEHTVRRALERAELIRENRRYRESLEVVNGELTAALGQLQADEEAARRLQFELLPEDGLRCGEYTLGRRLYPSAYLSGDFADYFPIGEHHLGLYIADVSGHGVASALVTVMLKTLVSQCRELHYGSGADTILRPELTLQRLNRELYALGLNKYLTIFYGVVDLERHVMACSSGGHFPHPILHDGREPRLLPLRGRPIGLFEDSRYECQEVVLPPASLLLLASDGVLELLPGESLTAKQAALLARVRSAGSTLDEITAGLDPDGGRPPADDVTYVLMKRARNHA